MPTHSGGLPIHFQPVSRTEPPSRARRADAERNRDKILGAARAAFADLDAEISMAEISRRAGVGMATLYRNFPGRRELLEALYTQEVDAVCEAAGTLEAETPGAVLVAWLHRFFAFITSKRPIAAELLKHTDSANPIFGTNRARVIAAAQPSSPPRRKPTRSAITSASNKYSILSSPSRPSTRTAAMSNRSSRPRLMGYALEGRERWLDFAGRLPRYRRGCRVTVGGSRR